GRLPAVLPMQIVPCKRSDSSCSSRSCHVSADYVRILPRKTTGRKSGRRRANGATRGGGGLRPTMPVLHFLEGKYEVSKSLAGDRGRYGDRGKRGGCGRAVGSPRTRVAGPGGARLLGRRGRARDGPLLRQHAMQVRGWLHLPRARSGG